MGDRDPRFDNWLRDLEQRHLADLRFSDVARALRALSSAYVERRASGLAKHRDLDGLGKRAAFALYYGPLHFLLTQAIIRQLSPASQPVIDLGCGTGAAGAAVATAIDATAVSASDSHPWALDEARRTYRSFGLTADVRRGDVARFKPPRGKTLVVAAFVLNELDNTARDSLATTLLDARGRGVSALIVEPISLRVSPWWSSLTRAFADAGGRSDEWRFAIEPPPLVKRLARATGLNPETLTARTLFVSRAS